jgi:hypothetical protein
MLRRDYPVRGYYDWPPPPLSAVRARWLLWLSLASISVAVLALISFVVDHDDPREPGLSERSWLTLALAAVLLVLLSLHHRYGAWPLVRAIAEYAVVALLAVLLTITAMPTPPPNPPRPAAAQPAINQRAGRAGIAAKAASGCPPVKQLPAWLACFWRQANPPPLKPTKGHATAPAPVPLSTRRTL